MKCPMLAGHNYTGRIVLVGREKREQREKSNLLSQGVRLLLRRYIHVPLCAERVRSIHYQDMDNDVTSEEKRRR